MFHDFELLSSVLQRLMLALQQTKSRMHLQYTVHYQWTERQSPNSTNHRAQDPDLAPFSFRIVSREFHPIMSIPLVGRYSIASNKSRP